MITKVILIGAGRGSRLMPLTTSQPKSFTSISGKRILDWTLEAFSSNGLHDFVFVSGYLKRVIEHEYPNFVFSENKDWENNNILFSLLSARNHLEKGFYSSYTDTLYQVNAITSLKESPYDITLVMDTEWRERYKFRSQHPESDGEKMVPTDKESRWAVPMPPQVCTWSLERRKISPKFCLTNSPTLNCLWLNA